MGIKANERPFIATPKCYVVGRQAFDNRRFAQFLRDEGHDKWDTEAPTGPQKLVEVAGRICYMSFDKGRPHEDYIANILAEGHGSVLEHAVFSMILTGVSRSFTHELVRHRAGMAYCLAGDAVVYSGSRQKGRHDGVKKSWTMKQLWEWSQDPAYKGKLKLIKVRTFDGEKFVPAKIKAISESGEKAIYKLTLSDGKAIRASGDHLFLTGWNQAQNYGAWTPVKMLIPGTMSVGCNGRPLGFKVSDETRRKLSIAKLGDKNPMWMGDAASSQAGRIRAQKQYSTVGKTCDACGSDQNLHRHHIDGDTHNNSPENIGILCATCHQHEHHLGREMTVKWVTVESVEPDGFEMTYDLEIDHPLHNFVANGIVTHNSQLSQRFVDEDSGQVVCPEMIRACKGDPTYGHIYDYWVETCKRQFAAYSYLKEALHNKLAMPSGEAIGKDELVKLKTLNRKKVNGAARSVLPEATETKITVTANTRALRNLFDQRGSHAADPEIRAVAIAIFEGVYADSPDIFGDYELYEHEEAGTCLRGKYKKV